MFKKHVENIQTTPYKDTQLPNNAVTEDWIESVKIDLIYLLMKIDPQAALKLAGRCVSLNINFLRTNTD